MHVDGAGVSDVRSLMAAGGNVQMAALSSPVQRHGGGGDTAGVHDAAAHGIAGGGGAMPHGDTIQKAFGGHDISGISAHVGGRAAEANAAMGAEAYATGTNVAFKAQPDLHTAAHEAAHIVQQRSGVSLAGGVGQVGDRYEGHADRVADLVVQGKSAEGELDAMAGGGSRGVQRAAVQRDMVDGAMDLPRKAAKWIPGAREAWRAVTWAAFPAGLPQTLISHYIYGGGKNLDLTVAQMKEVVSVASSDFSLTALPGFNGFLKQAKQHGSAKIPPNAVPVSVVKPLTLGGFTARFNGTLKSNKVGDWTFAGTVSFYDEWDFDVIQKGPEGKALLEQIRSAPERFAKKWDSRGTAGQLKTIIGAGIPGDPFKILGNATCSQTLRGGGPKLS
ncbi:MAG: DUF4157 domain-containing protein [Myxococcales bacterium]|nr:DUF4157 domain-containing protein [Myxococcales bacterium]